MEGDSLWEENTPLDSLITKNWPEMGLERADRIIHHVQWEYPRFLAGHRPTQEHSRQASTLQVLIKRHDTILLAVIHFGSVARLDTNLWYNEVHGEVGI